MLESKFKSYLKNNLFQSDGTIVSRINNLRRIENYYGNLDDNYERNELNSIFDALTLKKGENIKHSIPINGDAYNGTATLKAALGLYFDYKNFELETENRHVENKSTPSQLQSDYKTLITRSLDKIEYSHKNFKDKVDELQAYIFELLTIDLKNIEWKIEEKISDNCKDRVDIIGFDSEKDITIVLELDASRADQVAKKYLSRQALLIHKNLLYISVCYPGTKSMSKPECAKYFDYCSTISNALNNEIISKEYIGYFL